MFSRLIRGVAEGSNGMTGATTIVQWTESRSGICSGSCHHQVPPKRIHRNAHPLLHVCGLRLCLKHALRGRGQLEGSARQQSR